MNVHLRHCIFDGRADIEIGLTGVVRMDTALHADLGRTTRPRLAGAPGNFL